MKRKLCIIVTVALIFFCSSTFAVAYEAENPSVGLKVVDLLLVRPICAVGSTISTAVFLPLAPFVFIIGIGEPTARVMVEAPWRFTGGRYLGQFNHYKDEAPITVVSDNG